MTLELTLSAVVPLLVGLLNLLVGAYALASAASSGKPGALVAAARFATGPVGVGGWALAWFVAAFEPASLPVMQPVGAAGLLLGVLGAFADALVRTAPRRRPWVWGAALAGGGLVGAAVLGLLGPRAIGLGLVSRILGLAGLGGVAMAQVFLLGGASRAGARRALFGLASCAAGYAALAAVAYLRDRIAVDVLLFVVLALELLALDAIVERRVAVEVLLARALTYAFLSLVVAGLAVLAFTWLGYEVDLVVSSATVAVALVASALFMGLADPISARVERTLFPGRVRLEAALEASRAELRALERRLERAERLALAGELAASVAHEIKNPLAPVRGYAQMLEGRLAAVDPEARGLFEKGLGIIKSEADRIDARVKELLDLSRAKSPALDPEARFILQDVLREAVLVARAEPGARRVDVSGADAPIEVLGDSDAVRSALVNLLKNAAEAMEQGPGPGMIDVQVERTEQGATVRVVDEGPGLPEADEARAFDAFYTTKAGGTGLGLAIARSAVQACGGQLSLRPRPDGRGAVAELCLLCPEPALEEATTA